MNRGLLGSILYGRRKIMKKPLTFYQYCGFISPHDSGPKSIVNWCKSS